MYAPVVNYFIKCLQGVPVMIRIGEKDETVSPYFSRRMYRLLTEQGNDVTYNELPDKQHWWWDTYEENDGGVVNDGKMRKFFSKHSSFAIRRVSTQGFFSNCEIFFVKSYVFDIILISLCPRSLRRR